MTTIINKYVETQGLKEQKAKEWKAPSCQRESEGMDGEMMSPLEFKTLLVCPFLCSSGDTPPEELSTGSSYFPTLILLLVI